MKKRLFFIILIALTAGITVYSQNSDDRYKKTLKEVLKEIEQRFHITIKYAPEMIEGQWVSYADWRFRQDAEITLKNVLTPLDMGFNKTGPHEYKLKYYEYYRWAVEDGWQKLDSLASRYSDRNSWEKRKAQLRPELFKALLLSPLSDAPKSQPIKTRKRIMNGYSIENIAIEIMPGLYVNGSLYSPLKIKSKIPVVLCPDGHWEKQRYRADCQLRCATIARMGALAFSYDLFAWGESLLQFKPEDHRRSLAQTIQTLGGIRILDYLLSLKEADPERVAISGGSGGGSHTVLMTALDDRITLSAPVVSLSSYFYGGCPCECGMPIHFCGGGTNNVELAAIAAPRPQLVVSDGKDWTDRMPEHDFPYLQKIYGYYDKKELVENVHLPSEGHDFGISKRTALYDFLAKNFNLDKSAIQGKSGKYDESSVTIEPEQAMYVFGQKGENLPSNAIKGFDNLQKLFMETIRK